MIRPRGPVARTCERFAPISRANARTAGPACTTGFEGWIAGWSSTIDSGSGDVVADSDTAGGSGFDA